MNLTIHGYSTALFSTWYMIEELGLLFDAGDGVCTQLMQKARKIKHVFISHADRDHLAGLLQFNQLNARKDFPKIYYPKDCGSFAHLEQFTKSFDPHVKGTVWQGIEGDTNTLIKAGTRVRTIRNGHVVREGQPDKSFSFVVELVKRKLKKEYLSLSGKEIGQLRKVKPIEELTDQIIQPLLGYSGDTPVEGAERWEHIPVLIHEATFLKRSDVHAKGNLHSSLDELMPMLSNLALEKLILGHFSSRYDQQMIDQAIRKECKTYNIDFPVYRVLPGQCVRDILNTNPINS
ncbi:MAG: MBL fold metallo-hydrolase [Saprospiraceae bacterium]|nr:MBL fold metallo-hydrolase [Saprospiraceae bacterium]